MKTKRIAVKKYLPLIWFAFAGAGGPALAQGLPEGDGLKIIAVSCTQCHGLDRLTKVELTAAEWENALYDMMARGAIVERDDLDTVRDYLVTAFTTDGRGD